MIDTTPIVKAFIVAVDHESNWTKTRALATLEAMTARIKALEDALRDAIEFADEGWGYADDYFKDKWGFAEEIARLKALLAPTT